ncbi:MAG: 3,4-dihydroxy-2-butanone-4-phosphate synthase [Rhodobiaceae bacterium]|jgi:3,4-dihydroxy 2-butanone 4-phosphate synthase/GTP cyclohydrolase II|nr:3,4-dihydroxy-2-butanone-4-phosphate synthase [Rhodobiaceae bacterium]
MSEFSQYISTPEEIIEDARNGKMIVLVDAEDRENEGDLIIPAQMATPDAVNFMAKFGRGLICLTMTSERSDQLGLEFMSQNNRSQHQTAFTVSIEAREGITTGISAHDRSQTISVAIDPTKGMPDIVSPGHVFPLVARDGGVLMRAGHTEASVDLSRLAGLYPAGVICEIMNDDGTMARLPDLVQFAQIHGLKLGTIADLIAYRRKKDTLMKRIHEDVFKLANGSEMAAHVYLNTVTNEEHIALVKGDITGPAPVLTRFHAENLVADIAGSGMPRAGVFESALNAIDAEGRGVVVIIRNTSPTPFTDSMNPQSSGDPMPTRLLDYGVGAQIVADLGLHEIELLSDTPRTVVALEGYDLKIVGQRAITA